MPLDSRTRAFRKWIRHLDPVAGIDAAHDATGISRRTLQRIYAGKQPLPDGLAHELADRCTAPAIAAELRAPAIQETPRG